MPLKLSPDAPADGLKIVEARMGQFPREMFLGGDRSSWLDAGSSPSRSVAIVPCPIRVYALPPSEVIHRPDPLDFVVAGPWLYFVVSVLDSGPIEEVTPEEVEIEGGIELVAASGDGAWDIGRIAAGRYYRNFGRILFEANDKNEDVEPRLLDVPGLGCRALWFSGPAGRGDHFSWLPSTEAGEPEPLISYEVFLDLLRKLAPSSVDGDRSRPRQALTTQEAFTLDRSRISPFNPYQKRSERLAALQLEASPGPMRHLSPADSWDPASLIFNFAPNASSVRMREAEGWHSEMGAHTMTTIPPEAQETIRNLQAMSESDLIIFLGREIDAFSHSQLRGEVATDARTLLGGWGGDPGHPGFLSRLGQNFLKKLHRSFYSLICDPSDPDNAKVKASLDLGVEAGSYTLALVIASTIGLGWGIAIAAATIISKRVIAAGQGAFCETFKPDA